MPKLYWFVALLPKMFDLKMSISFEWSLFLEAILADRMGKNNRFQLFSVALDMTKYKNETIWRLHEMSNFEFKCYGKQ